MAGSDGGGAGRGGVGRGVGVAAAKGVAVITTAKAAIEIWEKAAPHVRPTMARVLDPRTARRQAVRAARTTRDGSWMEVWVASTRHYVVWSGDRPVQAFPPVEGDLGSAVEHADLARRRRPGTRRTS